MASGARTVLPFGFGRKGVVLEYIAAVGAILMLAVTAVALSKGYASLGRLPMPVAIHLLTLIPVVILTPIMFVGAKGSTTHRILGWTWCGLITATAVSTIFIRDGETGHFSLIHIFTLMTLVSVPRILFNAKKHRVESHRWSVLGLTYGALLIAGYFAFVGNRFLAQALML
jgi:uncharacterized membrane protein